MRRRTLDGAGLSRPRAAGRRAHTKEETPPGRDAPRRFVSTLGRRGLPNPPTQEPSNLGHHPAHVLVLPGRKPAPLVGQPEVETQLVQGGIGLREPVAALGAPASLRIQQ